MAVRFDVSALYGGMLELQFAGVDGPIKTSSHYPTQAELIYGLKESGFNVENAQDIEGMDLTELPFMDADMSITLGRCCLDYVEGITEETGNLADAGLKEHVGGGIHLLKEEAGIPVQVLEFIGQKLVKHAQIEEGEG